MKMRVISKGGRVIGTQAVTPATGEARITAVLRAGPGQQVHEVEVAAPGELASAKAIDAFHRVVAKSVKPRKAGKKAKRK
jgi:hypothetical protein